MILARIISSPNMGPLSTVGLLKSAMLGAYARCDRSSEAENLNELKKLIDKQLKLASREP